MHVSDVRAKTPVIRAGSGTFFQSRRRAQFWARQRPEIMSKHQMAINRSDIHPLRNNRQRSRTLLRCDVQPAGLRLAACVAAVLACLFSGSMSRSVAADEPAAAAAVADEDAAAEGTATPVKSSRLHVRSAELLDGETAVQLRGVAMGDVLLARQGRPASDYEVIAREWGANTVRLSVHPGVWLHQRREKVLAALDENVTAARSAGLYVIIVWHAIGWPNGYAQESSPDFPDAYSGSIPIAIEFWGTVSRKYGADGGVLFELWNEPVFQKDEYAPEVGQKWPELKPFLNKLVATIRAHSKNVIIASSNRWAYNLRGIRNDLLPGDNIAYAWHVYAGHSNNDPAQWAEHLDDLQSVAPVIVTEWGFERDSKQHFGGTPETFADRFTADFLVGKKLHPIAWVWHPDWGPAMLKNDWRTPTEFGAYAQKFMLKQQAESRKADESAK